MKDELLDRVFEALESERELSPSVADDARTREVIEQHARLVAALRQQAAKGGTDDQLWMQRVLDEVAPKPKRPSLKWAVALAAAAGLILTIVLARDPTPPGQEPPSRIATLGSTVELVFRPGTIRQAPSNPENRFSPGDRVRVSSPSPVAAIRVYFNDRRIVAQCGTRMSCGGDTDRTGIDATLRLPGQYTAVVITGSGTVPTSSGVLDDDVGTLRKAGFQTEILPSFEAL